MRYHRVWKPVVWMCAVGFILLNVLAWNHARCMLEYTDDGNRTQTIEHLTLSDKIGILFRGINLPKPSGDRVPADYGMELSARGFPRLW